MFPGCACVTEADLNGFLERNFQYNVFFCYYITEALRLIAELFKM